MKIINNGIKLTEVQKATLYRGFNAVYMQAVSDKKDHETIIFEVSPSNNQGVCIHLFTTFEGIDHKFTIAKKFIGPRGGLRDSY